MLGSLPEFVAPLRLARRQARLRGAVPVAELPRIAAIVRDDSGVAEFALHFRLSASGVPRLEGRIGLTAFLTCQRCLEPIDLDLVPALRVAFTDGDEASERAELAAGYEPLDCNGRIGLKTLVEDEILLALPDFPMHRIEECAAAGENGAPESGESPFSGLRTQLQQLRI